ncbi:hypothetical protein LUZ60_012329 [Juncus effusus]|nr:hypothetical protein LUZ60_012329 [Juncus effusus]
MAISFSIKFLAFLTLSFLVCLVHGVQDTSGLSGNFYDKNCPGLQGFVRSIMDDYINKKNDKRMGASILRLFFHDAFVNGCDGGPLLDVDMLGQTEKTAGPNDQSLRGFDAIDAIKTKVESSCPKKIAPNQGAVSCADILVLAARESVNLLGGPTWDVLLGRKDTRLSDPTSANNNLPGPGSTLSQLFAKFDSQNLNVDEMTALSGAHTIGEGQCMFFRDRIYTDKNINSSFADMRQETCPDTQGVGDSNLAPLDNQTTTIFDNKYYDDLVLQKGLFHSDQELYNSTSTDSDSQKLLEQTQKKVIAYRDNGDLFASDFAKAMVKLANLRRPKTALFGEVRLDCKKINPSLF